MVMIPFPVIVLLGIVACTREAYRVIGLRQLRNLGSLFAFVYITVVYAMLAWGDHIPIDFHGSLYVRAGIFLIFLDKVIAFMYELISRWNQWKT